LYVNDVALSSLADAAAGSTLNEKINTINADLDGKGAEASALVSYEFNGVGDGQLVAGTDTFVLTVLDGDNNTTTYTITDTKNMDELASKINSDTAVSATITESGRLALSQEGVVSVTATATGTTLAAVVGADGNEVDEFRMVFNDTSTDGSGVKIEAADDTAATATAITNLQALGLDATDDQGNLQGDTVATGALNEGDLIINGVEVGAVTAGTAVAGQATNLIEAINKISSETGVVAYAGEQTSGIALASVSGDLSIKYGDNITNANAFARTGLQERNDAVGAGSVSGISIATAAGAQRAVDVIDTALEQINSTRADLGAVNNRLDFTVSNLGNVSENTSAARSRVMDADFASETAQLSRAQVLQQASQAMLAQANARPQQVLSLLQ
jgi:flagellin